MLPFLFSSRHFVSYSSNFLTLPSLRPGSSSQIPFPWIHSRVALDARSDRCPSSVRLVLDVTAGGWQSRSDRGSNAVSATRPPHRIVQDGFSTTHALIFQRLTLGYCVLSGYYSAEKLRFNFLTFWGEMHTSSQLLLIMHHLWLIYFQSLHQMFKNVWLSIKIFSVSDDNLEYKRCPMTQLLFTLTPLK